MTISLGFAACLFAGCSSHHASQQSTAPQLPAVQTVTVKTASFDETIPVSGTLGPLPNDETTIVPQVTGTLISLGVSIGESVQKGQKIGQISPAIPSSQVAQSEAALNQARVSEEEAEANYLQQAAQTRTAILLANANVRSADAALAADEAGLTGDTAAVDNANQNLKRTQSLYAQGLVATKDLEAAQLQVATAQAALTSQKETIEGQKQAILAAQQQLEAARTGKIQDSIKQKDIQIAKEQIQSASGALTQSKTTASLYTLIAPISGKITEVGAAIGETVDTATKVVTIANLSQMQLTLDVTGDRVAQVAPGDDVLMHSDLLPAGVQIQARVQTISSGFDMASGTVPVLALVDNSAGYLKDDSTVTAQIVVAHRKNVVVIPKSAVITDPETGNKSIATVDHGGILHLRSITLGAEENGDIAVTSGAKAGDTVVISGQYGLADGTQVSASPAQSSSDGS